MTYDSYKEVRDYSLKLVEPLEIEDFIPQPAEFVSPPKWNLAHTSWFFEEFILNGLKAYKRFHPDYAFLFNSYYNAVGDRVNRAYRGALSRPLVKEIFSYREYVDEHMLEFIHSGKATKEQKALIVLGLNHEQQHQELLLSDIKFILGSNPLFPVYSSDTMVEKAGPGALNFISVKEGVYDIGYSGRGFCYDNELNPHKVYLTSFEIREDLVRNGEFMEFMNAGGYNDPSLWHAEGWEWKTKEKAEAPLYWYSNEGEWFHFTFTGLGKINPQGILSHVSYYEAFAFAQWKGLRLPTEFEWEAASDRIHWGDRWEWSESAYLPYPGFKKAEGALGEYNGKFMVNQKVLRGASVATSPGHSRKTYRNFFHPNESWQFTGIRLVK